MVFHPDMNPDEEAEIKFKKISDAYSVLSDRDKQREYDISGYKSGNGLGNMGRWSNPSGWNEEPCHKKKCSGLDALFARRSRFPKPKQRNHKTITE